MNKQEFLDTLRRQTAALSEAERARLLDYYAEMIDDRVEEGIDEAEAVAALGDPVRLARELCPAAPAQGPSVDALRGLRLRVNNADVTISAAALDNGAAAQLRFSDPERFRWSMDGDTLQIEEQDPPAHAGLLGLLQLGFSPSRTVSVTLAGPLEGALEWNARGGDLRLEGVRLGGGATLHSASGDIELKRLSAESLQIQTASGDVEAAELALGGPLSLNAASGDVELRDVCCDELNLSTASGDIELKRVCAGATAIHTASGDVELEGLESDPTLVVETASGDVELSRCIAIETRLTTASGDVSLRLPALPCGYDLSADTRSGDVRLPRDNPARAGEKQPRIAVRTVSGDIEARIVE